MSAASMFICLIIPAFTGWPLNTSDNPTKHNSGCLLICHLKIIIHLIIKLNCVFVCFASNSCLYSHKYYPCSCVYNRLIEIVTRKIAIFLFASFFSSKTFLCERSSLSKCWMMRIYWWMCLQTRKELFLFLFSCQQEINFKYPLCIYQINGPHDSISDPTFSTFLKLPLMGH